MTRKPSQFAVEKRLLVKFHYIVIVAAILMMGLASRFPIGNVVRNRRVSLFITQICKLSLEGSD